MYLFSCICILASSFISITSSSFYIAYSVFFASFSIIIFSYFIFVSSSSIILHSSPTCEGSEGHCYLHPAVRENGVSTLFQVLELLLYSSSSFIHYLLSLSSPILFLTHPFPSTPSGECHLQEKRSIFNLASTICSLLVSCVLTVQGKPSPSPHSQRQQNDTLIHKKLSLVYRKRRSGRKDLQVSSSINGKV